MRDVYVSVLKCCRAANGCDRMATFAVSDEYGEMVLYACPAHREDAIELLSGGDAPRHRA